MRARHAERRGRFWHNGQVSRPSRRRLGWGRVATRSRARTGRWSEGVAGSTSPESTVMLSRTSTWSIWLCGRCAGYVRPNTARRQPGQHRDRHPVPRGCSRRRRPPAARCAAAAVAARGGDASARAARASTTRARPRRRPRFPRRRPCTSAPSACRTDRAGYADRELAARRRSGGASRCAISTCPSPGTACRARRPLIVSVAKSTVSTW